MKAPAPDAKHANGATPNCVNFGDYRETRYQCRQCYRRCKPACIKATRHTATEIIDRRLAEARQRRAESEKARWRTRRLGEQMRTAAREIFGVRTWSELAPQQIRTVLEAVQNQEKTMNANQVQIDGYYTCKVDHKLTIVHVIDENPAGGWTAINTKTGKRIHVKTAKRLIELVDPRTGKPPANPVAPTCEPAAQSSQTTTEEKERDTAQPVATGGQAEKPAAGNEQAASTGRKMSLVEAAVVVLQDTAEPMNTKRILALVTERGLWSSPAGKTPHNTLYAAILREIRDKGDKSRFEKVERGKFALKS